MGDGDYCRSLTFNGDHMVFDTRTFPSIAAAQRGDAPAQSSKIKRAKAPLIRSDANQQKGPTPPLEQIVSNEGRRQSGTAAGDETLVKSSKEPEEFLLYDYDTEDSDADDSDMEDFDIVESDPITSADKNKVQQSKERQ